MSADGKPDLLARLVAWHSRLFGLQPLTLSIGEQVALRSDIADAADEVSGLRARVAELEAELAELRKVNEEGR